MKWCLRLLDDGSGDAAALLLYLRLKGGGVGSALILLKVKVVTVHCLLLLLGRSARRTAAAFGRSSYSKLKVTVELYGFNCFFWLL